MEEMNRHDTYTVMLGRHRSVIWAMCWAHARGRWDDCCDLVQEVSMALWENYDKLRPGASFKEERAWVRWQARSVFDRMQRRRQVETTPLTDRLAATLADEDSRQAQEDMEELLASLSPDEQRMVRLQMEGYQANEIASLMGLKRDAVYQRMHRIIVKARRALVVVLLLFVVSTVAIAVVPQWRKTVFGHVETQEAVEEEEPPMPARTPRCAEQQTSTLVQGEEQDSADSRVWIPPEPVPYLTEVDLPSDLSLPPAPQKHKEPRITIEGFSISVTGAENKMVRVYNPAGMLVALKKSHGVCKIDINCKSKEDYTQGLSGYIIQIGEDPGTYYRVSW